MRLRARKELLSAKPDVPAHQKGAALMAAPESEQEECLGCCPATIGFRGRRRSGGNGGFGRGGWSWGFRFDNRRRFGIVGRFRRNLRGGGRGVSGRRIRNIGAVRGIRILGSTKELPAGVGLVIGALAGGEFLAFGTGKGGLHKAPENG